MLQQSETKTIESRFARNEIATKRLFKIMTTNERSLNSNSEMDIREKKKEKKKVCPGLEQEITKDLLREQVHLKFSTATLVVHTADSRAS